MAVYSAADIVGKQLYAKRNVPVKALPFDDQPTLYTVGKGAIIGKVYSWVEPRAGRKNLWWIIDSVDGSQYYVEHLPGAFDVKALGWQGLLSDEEKAWKEKPIIQKALSIAALGAGVWLGWEFLKLKTKTAIYKRVLR